MLALRAVDAQEVRSLVTILAAIFCLPLAVTASYAAASGSYGGLGATRSAFYRSNPTGQGRPPLGVAYYYVDLTQLGRVVAYHVVINAKPAFGNRERLFLTEGINLPPDAQQVRFRSTCHIWRSRTLYKLTGKRYAVATTRTGTTSARMHAASRPRC
jgi:hypothetical protein